MVTKDRPASDASYGSTFKEVWSKGKEIWFLDPISILSYKVHRLLGMPPSL